MQVQEFHDPARIVKTAKAVRAMFSRRAAPADLDDVEQDAALAAWETVRSGRIDPRKNSCGYMYRAGCRRAGLGAARALSAVSFPEAQAGRAREWQFRISVHGCGPEQDLGMDDADMSRLLTFVLPSAGAEGRQRALVHARACVLMRRELDRHLRAMPRRERLAIEMLLGYDGEAAGGEAEVAWCAGLSRIALTKAIRRLAAAVQQDTRARSARRAMIETQEDR